MPGITGLVVEGERPDAALSTMARAMCYEPDYTIASSVEPWMGMAAIGNNSPVRLASFNGVTLAFAGDPIRLDPLRTRLASKGIALPSNATDCDLLLHTFLQFGIDALCDLEGWYALALWESVEQRLSLITDRFGICPLYIWDGPPGFLFASEIKAIAAHPAFQRKIDPRGLAEFLNATFVLGDRTLYQDVRRVPPAQVITFEKNGLKQGTYWTFPFGDPADIYRFDEVLEEEARLIQAATRNQVHDDTCLLMTAGFDSRALAGSLDLHNHPRNFTAVSDGPRSLPRCAFRPPCCKDRRFTSCVYFSSSDAFSRTPRARASFRTEGLVSCHGYWNTAADMAVENLKRAPS